MTDPGGTCLFWSFVGELFLYCCFWGVVGRVVVCTGLAPLQSFALTAASRRAFRSHVWHPVYKPKARLHFLQGESWGSCSAALLLVEEETVSFGLWGETGVLLDSCWCTKAKDEPWVFLCEAGVPLKSC